MRRSAAPELFVCLAVAAAAGCGGGADPARTPPTIAYGEDVCAACGMIVSDPRYAAALVVQEEPAGTRTLLFDDLGELFAYERERPQLRVLRRWVRDAASSVESASDPSAWLALEEAWCVFAESLQTPMATGVAAYGSQEAAERSAQAHDGEARRCAAMLQH